MSLLQNAELDSAAGLNQRTTGILLAPHFISELLISEWYLALLADGGQNEVLMLVRQTPLATDTLILAWRKVFCLYLVFIIIIEIFYCFKSIISLLQLSPRTNKKIFRNTCILHFFSVFNFRSMFTILLLEF